MRAFIFALISVFALALPAAAQIGQSGGPISVNANGAEYMMEQGLVRWTGDVDVRQGENRLLADQVDIYLSESATNATGDIKSMIAKGNFYYVTPEETVKGDQGVYDIDTDVITVTGRVIMTQGEGNVVTGNKLIYRVSEGYAEINGTCQSRKCPRGERVGAIFNTNGN